MRTNPERRQRIADAAIEILARAGAHGLSHRAVDTEAALPPGTTSNYFNARHALLVAAGWRLAELHWQYVRSLRDETVGGLDRASLAVILEKVVTAPDPGVRVQNLARYELFLAGAREPDLQPILADIRDAALETAVVLLASAGLPEPGERVGFLASALNGLTFDHLTAPPGPLARSGPGALTIAHVLDAIFGLADEASVR